jgi:hypothetical protein
VFDYSAYSSEVSIVSGGQPSAPVVTCLNVDDKVKITWVAPSSNGYDILSYRVLIT